MNLLIKKAKKLHVATGKKYLQTKTTFHNYSKQYQIVSIPLKEKVFQNFFCSKGKTDFKNQIEYSILKCLSDLISNLDVGCIKDVLRGSLI